MAQRIRDRGCTLALVAFTTLLIELTRMTGAVDAQDAMIGARNIKMRSFVRCSETYAF